MTVIAVTNTPNEIAPTASDLSKPSTTARLSQSLPAPSVSAAARTTRPMSSVRGSSHAANTDRGAWAACSPSPAGACCPAGRNDRTATRTAIDDSSTATGTCTWTGTCAAATTAAIPAATTVPRENPAW